MKSRRMVMGYTDLGRILRGFREGIVMTDRDDGTLWLVSHDPNAVTVTPDGYGRFSLNTEFEEPVKIYGPYEGPMLAANGFTVRLLVRGSRFGYDTLPNMTSSGRILTRRGNATPVREVYVPQPFGPGDRLAWTPLES